MKHIVPKTVNELKFTLEKVQDHYTKCLNEYQNYIYVDCRHKMEFQNILQREK